MRTRVDTVCFPDIPSVHSGWHIREPRRRALRREKEPCGRGQGQGLCERKQHGKPLDILEEERKGSRVKGLNIFWRCAGWVCKKFGDGLSQCAQHKQQ